VGCRCERLDVWDAGAAKVIIDRPTSPALKGGAPHADFSAGMSVCPAGPACRVGSRRTKKNPDSIPSVGVTELASIVVTTMADDEVEFMQTDVFVNYCVYLCVQ